MPDNIARGPAAQMIFEITRSWDTTHKKIDYLMFDKV